MLATLVTIAHVSICLVLIGIVLLQQGKGADMGATFGGGSQTVFGASGADNLLTRVTTTLAFLFMVSSIILATNAQRKVADDGSLFQGAPSAQEAPVANTTPISSAETEAPAATTPAPDVAPAASAPEEAAAPAATPASE